MYSFKQYANKIPVIFDKEKSLYLYSGLSSVLVVLSVISYFIDPSLIYITIPILSSLVGIVITLRISYFSSRDFSYFLSILIGIIAVGSTLVLYLSSSTLSVILPLGFTLMTLTLIYYYWRQYNFNTKYLIGFSLIIGLSGLGMLVSFIQNEPNNILGSFLVFTIIGLYAYDFLANK